MSNSNQYIAIAQAWNGSDAEQGGSKEQGPKPAPSPVDAIGPDKVLTSAQINTLAMMAIAQQSEARGFEAGVAAKQAEVDAKNTPLSVQSILKDFLSGPTNASPEEVQAAFALPTNDSVDKIAAVGKTAMGRLSRIATAFVLANLPEEVQSKLKNKR